MATKAEELRIMAQEIKNETQVGANTAERVGTAFEQAANGLAELLQNNGDYYCGEQSSLEDAIASVPISYQKGGLTIHFHFPNITNNLSYILTNTSWSTNITDWQGVDDVPTAGSDNIVKSGGVAEELFFVSSMALRDGDITKAKYANLLIKEIYLNILLGENERIVLNYLGKSGLYYLSLTKYNSSDSSSEVVVNNFQIKDKEVTTLKNTNEDVVGYLLFDSDDYDTVITNQGEGLNRMPFLNKNAYDISKSPIIYSSIHIDDKAEEILDYVDNEFQKKFEGFLSNVDTRDDEKRKYANSLIKELYSVDNLEENERYVLSYLGKTGSYYYINIVKYNSSNQSSSQIITNEQIKDKEITELTDSNGNVLFRIIFDSTNYSTVITNQGEGLNRLPYFNKNVYDINNSIKIKDYIYQKEKTQNIAIWGDSITWGANATTDSKCYCMILQSLLLSNGYVNKVFNCGIGGENFQNILVRQGAFSFYLKNDVTLPSDKSAVIVETITNYILDRNFCNSWYGDNSYFPLLMQGEVGRGSADIKTVNPIYVRGIKCKMTFVGTAENGSIKLQLDEDLGGDLEIKAGTTISLAGNKLHYDIVVFSIGTNDGWTVKTDNTFDAEKSADNYIAMIDEAISYANTERFVVCSPYGGEALRVAGVEGLEYLENRLLKKYGKRFFNWRKYLITYGLSDAGLTPTAEDLEDISSGVCPRSLLSDSLHPNDFGHEVIGKELFDIIKQNGYIS